MARTKREAYRQGLKASMRRKKLENEPVLPAGGIGKVGKSRAGEETAYKASSGTAGVARDYVRSTAKKKVTAQAKIKAGTGLPDARTRGRITRQYSNAPTARHRKALVSGRSTPAGAASVIKDMPVKERGSTYNRMTRSGNPAQRNIARKLSDDPASRGEFTGKTRNELFDKADKKRWKAATVRYYNTHRGKKTK